MKHTYALLLVLILSLYSSMSWSEPIRIGAIFDQSGPMKNSEIPMLLFLKALVKQQNIDGGVLGKKIELFSKDSGNVDSLAQKNAEELIENNKVNAIFGCWTSSCRKAVRPIVESNNNILFYPLQYEGLEQSKNIIYTGLTPNQQIFPVLDYFSRKGIDRWILVGSDYVYPRKVNMIIRKYLNKELGVPRRKVFSRYAPLDEKNWKATIDYIQMIHSRGEDVAVVSTVNGSSNNALIETMNKKGLGHSVIPVVALSLGEDELNTVEDNMFEGNYASWGYFAGLNPEQESTIIKEYNLPEDTIFSSSKESLYIAFKLWLAAVEKANSVEPKKVLKNISGLTVKNFSGSVSILQENNHLKHPSYLGKLNKNKRFDIEVEQLLMIEAKPCPKKYYSNMGECAWQ